MGRDDAKGRRSISSLWWLAGSVVDESSRASCLVGDIDDHSTFDSPFMKKVLGRIKEKTESSPKLGVPLLDLEILSLISNGEISYNVR
jgi:hypothetical protein